MNKQVSDFIERVSFTEKDYKKLDTGFFKPYWYYAKMIAEAQLQKILRDKDVALISYVDEVYVDNIILLAKEMEVEDEMADKCKVQRK